MRTRIFANRPWSTALGALLAALVITSCSQEEALEQGTPLPEGKYPLELTAGGLEVVATPAQASTRGTFEGNWDGVESVRVIVNGKEKEYSVEAGQGSNSASLTPAEPLASTDKDFWWNSTEETKTVTALAPYQYGLSSSNSTITLPEVWEEKDFAECDVIGMSKTIAFSERNDPMTFRHLLAKVVVNLRKSNYLTTDKEIKVTLQNVYLSGTISKDQNGLYIDYINNLKTGNSTLHPLSNAEDVDFGDGPETPFASYTGLVIPDNKNYFTNDVILKIEVDGVTYNLTPQSMGHTGENSYEVRYRSGQVTTFNVTVKDQNLSAQTGELAQWEEGASNQGNAVTQP